MKSLSNINQFAKSTMPDLLHIISTRFHCGMRDTIATVIVQLEAARKLEPHDEELEFALANLKVIEHYSIEHIEKDRDYY